MDEESYNLINGKRSRSRQGIIIISTSVLTALVLLAFIAVFVVIPVVFMLSFTVEETIMFVRFNLPSERKDFEVKSPGLRNFYVNVSDVETNNTISLGAWHLLPWKLTNYSSLNADFDFDEALADSQYNVIIHFHGTGETRKDSYIMFMLLRFYVHVIPFDYRGYGDSSRGIMSENAVVEDCVQFCRSIFNKTNANIYFWGRSLGTSLAISTIARLKEEGLEPKGLILEAPFTTMRETIPVHPYGKLFAWLPWFTATILDPLEENGFYFNNEKSIVEVDSKIMIFHAEDDSIIPYTLGKKLSEIAINSRNSTQGNVTYHQVPAGYGCDHFWLYKFPSFLLYVWNFLGIEELD